MARHAMRVSRLGAERGKLQHESDVNQARVLTDRGAVGVVDAPPPGIDRAPVGTRSEDARRDGPEAVAGLHHVRGERRCRDRCAPVPARPAVESLRVPAPRARGSGPTSTAGGMRTTGPETVGGGAGSTSSSTVSGVATRAGTEVEVVGRPSHPRTLSSAPAGRSAHERGGDRQQRDRGGPGATREGRVEQGEQPARPVPATQQLRQEGEPEEQRPPPRDPDRRPADQTRERHRRAVGRWTREPSVAPGQISRRRVGCINNIHNIDAHCVVLRLEPSRIGVYHVNLEPHNGHSDLTDGLSVPLRSPLFHGRKAVAPEGPGRVRRHHRRTVRSGP